MNKLTHYEQTKIEKDAEKAIYFFQLISKTFPQTYAAQITAAYMTSQVHEQNK